MKKKQEAARNFCPWFVQPVLIYLKTPVSWYGVIWTVLNLTVGLAAFWSDLADRYLGPRKMNLLILVVIFAGYMYNGQEIVPIQFLKAVLPNPGDLGKNYTGETSIGCRIRGLKDGKEQTYYVYNNCSHHE